MARIVSLGMQIPEDPPPVGSIVRCPRCGAYVEYEDGDPYLPGIFEISGPAKVGWLMRCPACEYSRVFIKAGKLTKK